MSDRPGEDHDRRQSADQQGGRDDHQSTQGSQSATQQGNRQAGGGTTQRSGTRQQQSDTGGRPSAASPAGKQPRQGTTVQISDIFDRADTTMEMKAGVGLFASVGFGLGLVVLVGELFDDPVLFSGTAAAATVAPILAVLTARRATRRLPDLRGDLVYATTVVTSTGGVVAMFLAVWLFEVIVGRSTDLTTLVPLWLGVAVAGGVVGFLSLITARET